jgi:hypothetical protein
MAVAHDKLSIFNYEYNYCTFRACVNTICGHALLPSDRKGHVGVRVGSAACRLFYRRLLIIITYNNAILM